MRLIPLLAILISSIFVSMVHKPLTISTMMLLSAFPISGNALEQCKNTPMSEEISQEEQLQNVQGNSRYYYTGDGEAAFQMRLPTKEEIIDRGSAKQERFCDDGLLCCYDYLLVMGCE